MALEFSQIKLLVGPLVIQLVWYILKQLSTSVLVKVLIRNNNGGEGSSTWPASNYLLKVSGGGLLMGFNALSGHFVLHVKISLETSS